MPEQRSSKQSKLPGFNGTLRAAVEYCLLRFERLDRVRQLGLGDEELSIALAERQAAEAALNQLILRDGLTGLLSRESFDRIIEREYQRARRSRLPLSLLLIEVDSFQDLYRTGGQEVTDACLQQVGAVLHKMLKRPGDLAACYRRGCFAVILPETSPAGAQRQAERVRNRVAAPPPPLDLSASASTPISVSVAVLTMTAPRQPQRLQELLAQAEKLLERARQSGGNRVVSAVGSGNGRSANRRSAT